MAVRFCRECGARMTDTDKFCFNCGTPASPPVQATAEPAPVPVAPVYVPRIPVAEPIPRPVAPDVTAVPEEPSVPEEPQIPEAPVKAVYAPVPEQICHPMQQPLYRSAQEPVYPSMQQPTYAPPAYTPPAGPFADLNYPEPEQPQPAKAKKAKAPKEQKISAPAKPLPKRTFLNVFCSVLVCTLLVVLMLPTVLLVDLRMLADEDRILATLERVDLDEVPARDIFIDIDDDTTMLDWACQWMNKKLGKGFVSIFYHWEDLTPKKLTAFLKKTTVLELTADTTAGLLNDLMNGTSRTALDAGTIEDFLEDNSEFLEEEMDLVLDRSSRKQMAQQAMDLVGAEELSLELLSDSPALQIVSAALSVLVLIGLSVLAVLLIVLLFVISRKYVMAGVHDTGLVMLTVGIVMLVLTGAARLMSIVGAGENGIVYLTGVLAGGLLESGLLVSACIFAFGILLLAISSITRSVLKKKAANA